MFNLVMGRSHSFGSDHHILLFFVLTAGFLACYDHLQIHYTKGTAFFACSGLFDFSDLFHNSFATLFQLSLTVLVLYRLDYVFSLGCLVHPFIQTSS